MSVVEPEQAVSIWIVQCKCVAQSMGPFRCRRNAGNLKFNPIALFEMMNAPVESQKKFKAVFAWNKSPFIHIMS